MGGTCPFLCVFVWGLEGVSETLPGPAFCVSPNCKDYTLFQFIFQWIQRLNFFVAI